MTTGEKIAALRRSAGLSQEALAEELGISRQAVSRWETNESLPDTEKVIRLSRRFHVTTDYLLMEHMQESSPAHPQTSPDFRLLRLLRRSGIGLAATGVLLTLSGTLAAMLWAVQTHEWYTDFGRVGTALFFKWPGAVLFGGMMLLLLALALLGIRALLSRK